jgi:hypothetical protein
MIRKVMSSAMLMPSAMLIIHGANAWPCPAKKNTASQQCFSQIISALVWLSNALGQQVHECGGQQCARGQAEYSCVDLASAAQFSVIATTSPTMDASHQCADCY